MRRPIKGLFHNTPGHKPPQEPGKRGRKRTLSAGQLNEKQRQFIREYLIDQNGAAAARRAGYSTKTAGAIGSVLLRDPIIRGEIERLLSDKLKQTELSADGVLAKMKALTTGDVRDIFDHNGNLLHPRRLPDGIATRIASIKVKTERQPSDDPDGAAEVVFIHEIKLWGMDVQLTNLAKAFAMFSDKPAGNVVITIQGGLPPDPDDWNESIPDDIVSDDTQKGSVS